MFLKLIQLLSSIFLLTDGAVAQTTAKTYEWIDYGLYASEARRYMNLIDQNSNLTLVTTENVNGQTAPERLVPLTFIKHPSYPLRHQQVFFDPTHFGTPHSNPEGLAPHQMGFISSIKLVRRGRALQLADLPKQVVDENILPLAQEDLFVRVYYLEDQYEYSQLGRIQITTNGEWFFSSENMQPPPLNFHEKSRKISFIEVFKIIEEIKLTPPRKETLTKFTDCQLSLIPEEKGIKLEKIKPQRKIRNQLD